MFDFESREVEDENAAASNYAHLYHSSPVMAYWDADFRAFLATHALDGDRVLDLGCGPGSLWAAIRDLRPARLVGVDISDRMIDEARQTHPEGEFLVGRAHELPFPDGSFDAVICSSVLHHIPDTHLLGALAEITRVLDEHGRLIGREPKSGSFGQEPGWLSGSVMNLRHLAYRLTRSREFPEPPLGPHHHVFDLPTFCAAVEEHLHVTDITERFPFSQYFSRLQLAELARVVALFDHKLSGRPGSMFYYTAARNYYTADDVVSAARNARAATDRQMTDEEFLAYVEAAASEISRVFANE